MKNKAGMKNRRKNEKPLIEGSPHLDNHGMMVMSMLFLSWPCLVLAKLGDWLIKVRERTRLRSQPQPHSILINNFEISLTYIITLINLSVNSHETRDFPAIIVPVRRCSGLKRRVVVFTRYRIPGQRYLGAKPQSQNLASLFNVD